MEVLYRLRRTKNAKVYMFHAIDDVEEPFHITYNEFIDFLDDIELNYKVCPINRMPEKDGTIGNKVYLTFDDAYESVYTIVFPEMVKRNFNFTVFICLELIGKEGYLSKQQIIELANNELCTIGTHCLHHNLLRFLSDEQKRIEIKQSRHQLEKIIKKEVDIIAYPYGSVFAVDRKSCLFASQTYSLAFSTINANLPRKLTKHNKHYLPRINVN